MNQLQLDILPKDSSKIQLSSVVLFMEQLGYCYMAPTRSFSSGHELNKGRAYVSLNTAIKAHNGTYNEWHGRWFDPPFENISHEWFKAAKESKIVTSVSLQNSRKKGIIVQKHWVRFADTDNGKLFKAKYV